MTPPLRSANDPAYRAARRALARRLHPDLGGEPDAFITALTQLDNQIPATPIVVVKRTTAGRWQSLRRALRRRPRRYIDL